MTGKWFVQKEDGVEGPFSVDELKAYVSSGQILAHHLVWTTGFDHWIKYETWTQGGQVSGSRPRAEAWHYALNGQARGPMSRETLVGEVKNLPSLAEVVVWTKGMKEWAPLFEFHDLLTEIGVNKRQFPRADLDGRAVLKVEGNSMVANLLSISEGGLGITQTSGISLGQELSVEVQSPSFREPLFAKAHVRYIHDGVIGLKFTQMSVEAKGAIIQFIKQNQMRFTLKSA